MARIQVSSNAAEVGRALLDASKRIGNMLPLYQDIGAYMERSTDQRFAQEVDPDGRAWRPLSPNTLASKRNSKILNETGQLRDSLAYEASRREVVIGFADKKARWHQFGTRPYTIVPKNARMLRFMTPGGPAFASQVRHPGIPARPILGISQADEREILALVGEHVEMAPRRAGGS